MLVNLWDQYNSLYQKDIELCVFVILPIFYSWEMYQEVVGIAKLMNDKFNSNEKRNSQTNRDSASFVTVIGREGKWRIEELIMQEGWEPQSLFYGNDYIDWTIRYLLNLHYEHVR
jgi:hypothetical protein